MTSLPARARAAAISEPRKPPPMTANRFGRRAELPIILERAEVHDPILAEGQASWPASRGEKELVEGVNLALVVDDLLVHRVELLGPTAQVQIDVVLLGVAPDLLHRLLAGPEAFG